jgi:hypothetical protein
MQFIEGQPLDSSPAGYSSGLLRVLFGGRAKTLFSLSPVAKPAGDAIKFLGELQ